MRSFSLKIKDQSNSGVYQRMASGQKTESSQEVVFGGAEGPDAMYVKLVSSDDHEFYVKREYALTSGIIKAMLSGPGTLVTFSVLLC